MKTALTIFAAELDYQKDIFALAVGAILLTGAATAIYRKEWLGVIMVFGLIAYIVGAISIGSRMDSEKRERTGRMLPLQPVLYGSVRFLVFVTYNLVINAVVMVGTLISGVPWPAPNDLFTLFGLNLLITVLIFLNDDLYFIGGWPARIILWVTVLIAGLMSLVMSGKFGFTISPDQPKTVVEAVLFNVSWIILMVLDVWIYTQRKSYFK